MTPLKRSFLLLLLAASPLSAAPYADALKAAAREKNLARDPGWLRLLHVRGGLFGLSSDADGPHFFLSPRGKKDPQAELDATLEGFFKPLPADPEIQPPQCRFPARYAWLKERLSFDPALLPEQACPRLEEWLSKMDPAGLTLIYASAYMNNPASMYGHTFLRVEPAGGRAATPLLAYSVNFAAETGETNGIVFAVKGLMGGYRGRFSTLPYYMKVQKYTNMESRDLWEYRLNVSSQTTRRVMLHLWEMGNTWFDYYFLTENCSYQLLPLLESADPALDLSGRFHFKVIPVDTIRAIQSVPGLVRERVLRPSAVRMLMARRSLLTSRETEQAAALAAHPSNNALLEGIPAERQPLVLDSAFDRMRLAHHFARYPSLTDDADEHDLLLLRQRIPTPSPDVTESAKAGVSPPEESHATGRVGLGGGRSAGRGFTELSLRGAMHDTEDDPAGYVPGSRLEMFHLRLRYSDSPGKVYVRRGTAVDILSLSPLDRWIRYHSWKFFMGFDTPLDRPVAPGGGLLFRMNGGSGVTAGRTDGRFMAYALAGADGGLGGTLDRDYRLGWEGETGLLARAGRWRWHGEAFHRRYFLGEEKSLDGLRSTVSCSLGGPWETRFTASREGRRKEAMWMLHRYL